MFFAVKFSDYKRARVRQSITGSVSIPLKCTLPVPSHKPPSNCAYKKHTPTSSLQLNKYHKISAFRFASSLSQYRYPGIWKLYNANPTYVNNTK